MSGTKPWILLRKLSTEKVYLYSYNRFPPRSLFCIYDLGTTADFILFGYEIDKMYGYFIKTFAQLEKEDQFDVLNYVEYRRQLRDELEAFKTITQ